MSPERHICDEVFTAPHPGKSDPFAFDEWTREAYEAAGGDYHHLRSKYRDYGLWCCFYDADTGRLVVIPEGR